MKKNTKVQTPSPRETSSSKHQAEGNYSRRAGVLWRAARKTSTPKLQSTLRSNPKGWQKLAGDLVSEAPGRSGKIFSHPDGVPDHARGTDRAKNPIRNARCAFPHLTYLTHLTHLTFSLVVASFWCGLSHARADTLLLSNAIVHTVSGDTITNGEVFLANGKISAVGTNLTAPSVKVMDLGRQHLYPGMIALDTILGLTEIGSVRATQDSTESGEYTPDVESWIAVNPDSELIPVTRANGVAFFEPVPEGGIVSGQSALVTVEGWTSEQRTVKKPVALHLFWPSMELDTSARDRSRGRASGSTPPKSLEEQAKERTAKLRSLEDFFNEAAHYEKAKTAAANSKGPAQEIIPAWEAMLPCIRGELPVMVHADEIRQIRAAILWAGTNHLKTILVGGRDAWMAAELLAAKKIPVVYSHTFTLPPRDSDSYDVQFRAPEVLRKAGVEVSFGNGLSTMDAALTKNLPYAAAQAVAFGLPEPEAIKGLTLYPAQLTGTADRFGSIEQGKEATLFTCEGSILDARTKVTHLWVAGKEVSLENRHTRLYQKYKARPR